MSTTDYYVTACFQETSGIRALRNSSGTLLRPSLAASAALRSFFSPPASPRSRYSQGRLSRLTNNIFRAAAQSRGRRHALPDFSFSQFLPTYLFARRLCVEPRQTACIFTAETCLRLASAIALRILAAAWRTKAARRMSWNLTDDDVMGKMTTQSARDVQPVTSLAERTTNQPQQQGEAEHSYFPRSTKTRNRQLVVELPSKRRPRSCGVARS